MVTRNFYKLFLTCLSLALANVLAQAQGQQAQGQNETSAQSQSSISANKSGAAVSNNTGASTNVSSKQASAGLAGGSEINAKLSRPVDSNKNKPGDEVTATTTQDVKSAGKVVIPKGSKLIGRVTEAKPRGSATSQLGIVFDHALLKDGREVPINATIQAVAAAGSNLSGSGVDDFDTSVAGAGNAAASGRAAGGGLVGGATGAVGGTVGAVGKTAGGVGSTASSTVNGTAGAAANITRSPGAVGGLTATGQLASGSKGVFGLKGVEIASSTAGSAQGQGSLLTSAARNVRLDGGTSLLLVTDAQAASGAQ